MADMETDTHHAASDQGIDENEVPTGSSALPAIRSKRSLSHTEPVGQDAENSDSLSTRRDTPDTRSTGRRKRRREKAPTSGATVREADPRRGCKVSPESWMYLSKHKLQAAEALEKAETAFSKHDLLPPNMLIERVEGIRLRIDGLQADYKATWGNKLTTELRQTKRAIQPFYGRDGDTNGKPLFHTLYVRNLGTDPEIRRKLQPVLKSHMWQVEGVPPLLVRVDAPEEREPPPILLHNTQLSPSEATEALQQMDLPAKQVSNFGTSTLRVIFYKIAHANKFLQLWTQPGHALRDCFPDADPFNTGQVQGKEWSTVRISPALGETTRKFWLDALAQLQIPARGVRHDRRKDGSPLPWCSITIRTEDLGRLHEANLREHPDRPTSITPMKLEDLRDHSRNERISRPARHNTTRRDSSSPSREGGLDNPWERGRQPDDARANRNNASVQRTEAPVSLDRGRRNQHTSSSGHARRGSSATSRVSFMTNDSDDSRDDDELVDDRTKSKRSNATPSSTTLTLEHLTAAMSTLRDDLNRKIDEENENIFLRLEGMEQRAEEDRQSYRQLATSNQEKIAALTNLFKEDCRAREQSRERESSLQKATAQSYERALEDILTRLGEVEGRLASTERATTSQTRTQGPEVGNNNGSRRKNGEKKNAPEASTTTTQEKSGSSQQTNDRDSRDTLSRKDPTPK